MYIHNNSDRFRCTAGPVVPESDMSLCQQRGRVSREFVFMLSVKGSHSIIFKSRLLLSSLPAVSVKFSCLVDRVLRHNDQLIGQRGGEST